MSKQQQGDMESKMGQYNALTVIVFIVAFLAFGLVQELTGNSKVWNLLGFVIGAFGAGNILGFLYATFGEEEKRFGDWTKMANTAVASIVAADFLRNDSAIRSILRHTAESSGMIGATSVVGAIAVAFFSSGFLVFYVQKRLVLNPLAAKSASIVRRYEEDVEALNSIPLPDEPDPSTAQSALAEMRRSTTIASAVTTLVSRDSEIRNAEIKALILDNQLTTARLKLMDALRQSPQDGELLYYAGYVEHFLDNERDALSLFERASKAPNVPEGVWKFLGYLYLWYPDRLVESVKCSKRFLQSTPEDAGATLNLACAYGQLTPTSAYRQDTLDTVTKLLSLYPKYRKRVLELTEPGEDFAAWKDDPDFKKIVGI